MIVCDDGATHACPCLLTGTEHWTTNVASPELLGIPGLLLLRLYNLSGSELSQNFERTKTLK